MRFLRSSFGGALVQVMVVAGILAGLAPIIIKSGILKGQFTVEERQCILRSNIFNP